MASSARSLRRRRPEPAPARPTTAGKTVAVITTCYDQADYLHNILASVAAQKTRATVYHLIVDDGSRDDSLDVLRAWEETHKRVRVITVTNRGMAGAFNAGLIALPADADYVVTVAGDDWLAPTFVEQCLLAFTPDTGMVVPQMRRVVEGRKRRAERPMVQHPTLEQVWEWRSTLAYGCAMFRREALVEAGGFHPRVGGDCDWDMWVDLVARGYKFGYTTKTCFYYLHVPGSSLHSKTEDAWNAHRLEMARHHRQKTLPGLEWGR